jgi:hypothetical protein
MRTLTAREIEEFLREAGFSVNQLYSSFLKEPYKETSSRIVVVFTKDEGS